MTCERHGLPGFSLLAAARAATLPAMRLLVLLGALVACGNPRGPTDLRSFGTAGGGVVPCQSGDVWCSFEGDVFGDEINMRSQVSAMIARGTLAPSASDELDRLTDQIPFATPADHFVCADTPRHTIELDFAPEGLKSFRYDCDPGALANLHSFLQSVETDLMTCQPSFRFVTVECF